MTNVQIWAIWKNHLYVCTKSSRGQIVKILQLHLVRGQREIDDIGKIPSGEATDTAVVTIGSTPCEVTEVTNNYIECIVDGLAHGTYDISIDVTGKGI